jgi:predicted DNA-binding transcriptional regulator AlpA
MDQPQLLTQSQVSEAFGLSPRTLEDWRRTGSGPRFLRLSGQRGVRYRNTDVLEWLDTQIIANHRAAKRAQEETAA